MSKLKEIVGTIWTLFVIFVISMALWGDAILNFIKELFLTILIFLIIGGIVFFVVWYFWLRDDGWSA